MGSGKHSSKKRSSPLSSALKAKKKTKRSKDQRKKRSRRDRDRSRRHYSEDDSISTSSVAQSASDYDSHSKRRGRSLATRHMKARKRRAERSPSRSESSEDKRGRRKSKRRKDTDKRKKRREKKRRREPSVDSVSSLFHSCSTCGSSDDNAVRNSKSKARPEKPMRDENYMGKHISKNKHRSRSSSLSSQRDNRSERAESETRLTIEHQPKRLKSVVTVADERDRDEVKDEIVYEQDDYPSSRSNDSNDIGGAKDTVVHSKPITLSNVEHTREEKGVSDVVISGAPGSVSPGTELSEGAPSERSPKTDDLEAILRQKALENLKKFRDRTKLHRDEKENYDDKAKQLPDKNTELLLDKPDRESGVAFVNSVYMTDNVGSLTMEKDLDVSALKTGEDPDATKLGAVKQVTSHIPRRKESAHEPFPDRPSSMKIFNEHHSDRTRSVINLSSNKLAATNPSKDNTISERHQTNVLRSASNKEPLEINRTLKQAPTLLESTQQRIPSPLKRALSDAAKTTNAVSQGYKSVVAEGTSSAEALTGNQSAAVQTAEDEKQVGDGSSQFQQKTMTVMRGGELVQVNYKVYIPKNAPALARRKLKR